MNRDLKILNKVFINKNKNVYVIHYVHVCVYAWRIPWTEEPACQATIYGVPKSCT